MDGATERKKNLRKNSSPFQLKLHIVIHRRRRCRGVTRKKVRGNRWWTLIKFQDDFEEWEGWKIRVVQSFRLELLSRFHVESQNSSIRHDYPDLLAHPPYFSLSLPSINGRSLSCLSRSTPFLPVTFLNFANQQKVHWNKIEKLGISSRNGIFHKERL